MDDWFDCIITNVFKLLGKNSENVEDIFYTLFLVLCSTAVEKNLHIDNDIHYSIITLYYY